MPRQLPPIEHRFPANRPYAPHTQKHPNGYLTCKLKRILLKKQFRYEDPETQEILKMKGADAVVIKYVWEALQGNVQAIEGIFDRIDGKINSGLNIDQSTHYHYTKMSDEDLDNEIRKSYEDLFSKTTGRETTTKDE